jgi:hypothetical protein
MVSGTFNDYERDVVAALLSRRLPASVVESVLERAAPVSIEQTGLGYLLTAAHPGLPEERMVCNEPLLIGRVGDLECGFVIFIEDGELTLECHPWGDDVLPGDMRDRDIRVEAAS